MCSRLLLSLCFYSIPLPTYIFRRKTKKSLLQLNWKYSKVVCKTTATPFCKFYATGNSPAFAFVLFLYLCGLIVRFVQFSSWNNHFISETDTLEKRKTYEWSAKREKAEKQHCMHCYEQQVSRRQMCAKWYIKTGQVKGLLPQTTYTSAYKFHQTYQTK